MKKIALLTALACLVAGTANADITFFNHSKQTVVITLKDSHNYNYYGEVVAGGEKDIPLNKDIEPYYTLNAAGVVINHCEGANDQGKLVHHQYTISPDLSCHVVIGE